ncbi:MAG: 23S rRNA (pseudouridine(1915)-N(3))-methyltransferase RlmH [Erysipelotrichaceae bacterium]|nr:23S rRNA (pseudouridine(1915)-N(3))-methyltransferase RlmH [Erysipelotrichaceae bacterium]
MGILKIKLLAIGKIKERYFVDAINEYLKRLSRYVEVEIIELSDEPVKQLPNAKDIGRAVDIEGEKIYKNIKENDYVITLDLNKKEYESGIFADFIKNKFDNNGAHLTFVIGGSYGLSNKIKERANDSISLSKMTFTHQMSRVIFLEQVYRAFKILNNEVYHK